MLKRMTRYNSLGIWVRMQFLRWLDRAHLCIQQTKRPLLHLLSIWSVINTASQSSPPNDVILVYQFKSKRQLILQQRTPILSVRFSTFQWRDRHKHFYVGKIAAICNGFGALGYEMRNFGSVCSGRSKRYAPIRCASILSSRFYYYWACGNTKWE